MLDYYDGVLFLTTNRVGIVDEAFRSRIHLSLYYPALRKKQALEIFKLNIRRIKEIEKSKAEIRGKGDDSQPKLPSTEIDEESILNFATRHWENARNNPSRRVGSFCSMIGKCYGSLTFFVVERQADQKQLSNRLLSGQLEPN